MYSEQSLPQSSKQSLTITTIKTLTIDLETTGLDPWHDDIILIGYRINSTGPVRLFDWGRDIHGVVSYEDNEFLEALASPLVVKRGHNIHFDLLCLRAHGFVVDGPLDDTRILAYLENPSQELDLKTLVEKKLHRKVVRMEDFGRPKFSNKILAKHPKLIGNLVKAGKYYVARNTLAAYNRCDVINCDDLKRDLISSNWYRDVEQQLAKILFDAESRGMFLDIPYFKELENEFTQKIEELKETLGAGESFNPNSPKQVLEEFARRGSRLEATDKHTLKLLAWKGDKFAEQLLKYRGLSKLQSTYVRPLLDRNVEGRIHAYFNQAGRETESSGDIKGTATGRLSSSDPNLQNIPDRTEEGRKIRKGFIATPGFTLIDTDLKQIQPRLIAHYSQDPDLLKAYNEGLDTHAVMGARIFETTPDKLTKEQRQIGKTCWLGLIFGTFPEKLRYIVEKDSEVPIYYPQEFYEKVQASFWANSPYLRAWRERSLSEARASGHVETFGGRRIRIAELASKSKWERQQAERFAINYKIQGSEADVLKMCLIQLSKIPGYKLLAPVHDEALGEFEKRDPDLTQGFLADVHSAMTKTFILKNVPVEADTKIIENWSQK